YVTPDPIGLLGGLNATAYVSDPNAWVDPLGLSCVFANGTGAASNTKFVPNPHGKLGGPAHQAKVAEITADIRSRGLSPEPELRIPTPGGNKGTRYVDVVARDPATGKIVEYHQVGKQTKAQLPIARERRALDDIENAINIRPQFHPYN
ncbi:hypothetical protein, partial [Caulobacter rhizosphaerae]|uniref:hypothetical protein n=1 Tax=Caulobacter rhizosphaerae TaxID=2010972 RepID=UPI00286B88B4